MKDKKKIIISFFCILSVLLIAIGITYSIFTYTKKGNTGNTITTGKLTFLYTENTGTGTGISITNAFPVSDELGKTYSSDDQIFDFKVESEIVGNVSIPYEVTVGKTESSTLGEEYIKLYLTDITEIDEIELLQPIPFSFLPNSSTEEDEKQIYFDEVEASEAYLKKFRLRMWIAAGSDQNEINEKTFTVKVNVYSNKDVTKQKMNVLNIKAIDKNGTDLNATSTLITGNEKQVLLDKLVSDGFIDNNNKAITLVDIDTDDFTNTATTTINVSSLAAVGDKIVVFHYNETTDEWEHITTAEVNSNGTIEVDFISFSPIGLITVKNNDFTGITTCKYELGYTWNFNYTGGEQEFITPCYGTYKLETWGAQGGTFNSTCIGGYGGYSEGEINLPNKNSIFINVGGAGTGDGSHKERIGGYNGGGNATSNSDSNSRQSSGGGATHISKTSGVLSSLENNINDILIVSGGGGGFGANSVYGCNFNVIPSGGGFESPSNNIIYSNKVTIVYPANQTSGGYATKELTPGIPTQYEAGTFGQGVSSEYSGGGGGFFGGGATTPQSTGGSGYIGNTNLFNKVMYCYNCTESNEENIKTVSTTCHNNSAIENCSKEGHGYAKITLIDTK